MLNSHYLTIIYLLSMLAMSYCFNSIHRGRRFLRYLGFVSLASSSPILITSVTNEKVKLVKSLQVKKKRDQHNLILLEGLRLVVDSITTGNKPEVLFCTEEAYQSTQGQLLHDTLKKQSQLNLLSLVNDQVYKTLSDTVNGQGIIAAFPKPSFPYKALYFSTKDSTKDIPYPPLLLILDGLADPGNMGAIIRSGYGLGAQAILCIDTCDPYAPKVIRSSMSASLTLPLYETKWNSLSKLLEEIIEEYNQIYSAKWTVTDFQVLLADGGDDHSLSYHEVNYKLPSIIVIGNEANGISSEARAVAGSKIVKIPMSRPLESFNAAIAASIFLAAAAQERDLK